MHPLEPLSQPNRDAFAADPLGYAASGWHKWENSCIVAGVVASIREMPDPEDLKSPILWLCQAEALSQAAIYLVRNEPTFESMPLSVRGVCDCQYMGTALMLVGYSLEVCLKGFTIMVQVVPAYTENESSYRHHHLVRLAEIIPDLSDKEKAILRALTHFTMWAGRYPDPGTKYFSNTEEIFELSEKHEIHARDVFQLAAKVMGFSRKLVAERSTVSSD